MKILRPIGIIAGVLVALFIVLYFIAPKSSFFESSIVINAPKEKIYQVIDNMADFNQWSPWHEIDPDAAYTLEGPDKGPGAKLSWESDNPDVGNGSMWIDSNQPSDEVVYKMSFEGYNNEPIARLLLSETGEGTQVTWTYEDENTPGLYRIGNLFDVAETMLREPYANGLENLKTYVESLPEESMIEVTEMPALSYAGIEATVESSNSSAISQTMGELYGRVVGFLQANNREMTGMPFAIYPSFNESTLTMICAIPTTIEDLSGEGDIVIGEIPAGPVVKAIHTGPYDQLYETHTAIDLFMTENNLTAGGPPYEQYITDPGDEPDPEKWITWVIYPLAGTTP